MMEQQSDTAFYIDIEAAYEPRKPEIFEPVNLLKQKVGNGGIDSRRIEDAQKLIDECSDESFLPMAEELLSIIETLIKLCRHEHYHYSEKFIEDFAAAFVQLKAHGGMFQYPLMSEVAHNGLRFLDHIPCTDQKSMDVIEAHYNALKLIFEKRMKGHGGEFGQSLKKELDEACRRYFKAHPSMQ